METSLPALTQRKFDCKIELDLVVWATESSEAQTKAVGGSKWTIILVLTFAWYINVILD